MKHIIACFFLCTILDSSEVDIYTAKQIYLELEVYESAIEVKNPVASFDGFEEQIHEAYAISVSLPLVSAERWLSQVSKAYLDLSGWSEEELRQQVDNLEPSPPTIDYLVYDVYMRSGDSEYRALMINRGEEVKHWVEGMDVSAAMFEKNESGAWIRTALPPNHWVNYIPIFNVESLRELESGAAILIDDSNIPRFLPLGTIDRLPRIKMTE